MVKNMWKNLIKPCGSFRFDVSEVLSGSFGVSSSCERLNMKKNALLFALLFALLASTALLSARVSCAETLRDSVDQALAAHPSIESALAQKVVAKEDVHQTRSGLFPEVSTNVTAGRIFGDNSTSRGLSVSRGTAYSWLGEGSASLTQPIFDGMETFNRIDAARARNESADYNVIDVKENLAISAVQAHLSVMQAQAILDKTKSYYGVIEDYLDRIKLMVDEGVADETEAAQAKNISLMLKSTVTDYEGQLETAYATYREIIGQMPQSELIKPPTLDRLIQEDLESAIENAKTTHPLALSGLKDLEAAGFDVKAEKGVYLPDVDGEVSYLKRDQREEIGGEVEDARAVIKVSWDFETGGAQMARTRQKRAEYSDILAKNSETMRTIEADVRRAYAEYETAKKQVELVRKREVVTEDLFEAYQTQFEGARVRLLQLMQAENQLFNSQLETISAEYRYLFGQYAILASTGQLLETLMSGAYLLQKADIQNTVEEIVEVNEEMLEPAEDIAESIVHTVK